MDTNLIKEVEEIEAKQKKKIALAIDLLSNIDPTEDMTLYQLHEIQDRTNLPYWMLTDLRNAIRRDARQKFHNHRSSGKKKARK